MERLKTCIHVLCDLARLCKVYHHVYCCYFRNSSSSSHDSISSNSNNYSISRTIIPGRTTVNELSFLRGLGDTDGSKLLCNIPSLIEN